MGAWIETCVSCRAISDGQVAPRVGAWIETLKRLLLPNLPTMSHPVWVRGLKQSQSFRHLAQYHVAPRVGAWIETIRLQQIFYEYFVAPRVGAWIET